MSEAAHPDPFFWQGKRVLVTGHSGFKGAWLTLWLNRLGATVTGISLPPVTDPSLYKLAQVEGLAESHFCDICDASKLADLISAANPEIVFHLAAQPLVRASYREPRETFATNVIGTVHVLDALRGLEHVRVAVMVTTDKVYRNNEWPWAYREDDVLGGNDPYGASKAASEHAIASYREGFLSQQGVAVASARAGNVIGGGDWSEDRLVPDAMRAWQAGQVLRVRRPDAVRPWQHVLDPLAGYLILAQALWVKPEQAGAYNFGPESGTVATVRDVVEMMRAALVTSEVHYGEESGGPHEAGRLVLEIAKARCILGVKPKWALATAIERTMAWYRSLQDGADARRLCDADILAYEGSV